MTKHIARADDVALLRVFVNRLKAASTPRYQTTGLERALRRFETRLTEEPDAAPGSAVRTRRRATPK